jgi:virulence factor Mce-like protein
MRGRSGTASLVASPVLVGAVTVLVTVIAVFISYNANKGLPFVPTYDLKAELPSGGKLVKGNEVRLGGFRVGVIEDVEPKLISEPGGRQRAIAVAALKLDKVVEPLAVDSKLRTRPRSALGLKYIELSPGRSKRTLAPGDVLPLRQASEPLEFEHLYSIFDRKTRPAVREATEGFGDAFAGRGRALNRAIEALNPFFRSLLPVMENLASDRTRLNQFFRQLGGAAAQAAPVARTQAELFTHMATTFAAISSDPAALRATIEKSPPTEEVAIRSFRVQRPFLADFADLSRRLRPAARALPVALPKLNTAFRVGTPILPDTVVLNRRLERVFSELEDLFENPNTLLALRDLRTALRVTRPAAEYITPFQTVCNYAVYFFHGLGEHQSQVQTGPTGGGTVQNQNAKFVNTQQENNLGTVESSRAHDVPPDQRPHGARDGLGSPLSRFYSLTYQPAIDSRGNADCQQGQNGYPNGRLSSTGRYGPGLLSDGTPTGGNWPISDFNLPGLRGGTFKSRELGIDNLRDVR